MRKKLRLSLIMAGLLLSACSPQNLSMPATLSLATAALSSATQPASVGDDLQAGAFFILLEALKNASYSGVYDQPVTLKDGFFEQRLEGQSFTLQYVEHAEVYGDLDGDGIEDIVVFLLERGGGTASFTYVAAQLNQNGQPADAGAAMVEDRTQILSATIEDGKVVLDLTTRGPQDVDCCPSHKTRKVFALESGKLVETSGEAQELVRISADDLNGTSWTLLELNKGEPVLPDTEITASFGEGRMSGSGGCNSYNSGFTLGDDNPFKITIDPIVSTKKACPDQILNQETAYFNTLESASLWGYDHGKLVLFYVDEQGEYSRLLFAPQEATEGALVEAEHESGLTPAEIANDEGGPIVIKGDWNYSSYAVASHFEEPSVVLMDASNAILRDFSEFVPRSGQVLGMLTSPISPSPATYRLDVPSLPGGAMIDLDNDGDDDLGVQVYALTIAPNIVGDSFLVQLEQGGYSSYLVDPQTGAIRQGTFLVYAPDDAQGFPGDVGEDGEFFTTDDLAVGLPAGYTLATLHSDGTVSFDRSPQGRMDTLEAVAAASPNFSDQGFLESYNSLIDVLKVRYAFTELRNLDWEQIRQEYLLRVEEADGAVDLSAFYLALHDLSMSIRDAHVQVSGGPPEARTAPILRSLDLYGANLGAQLVELSDGRFIVTYLDPQGPSAKAGWQFGTEIVAVDGLPIEERIDSLPLVSAESTPEGIRLSQMNFALGFPDGATTTIEYRLPGEGELRSTRLIARTEFANQPPTADEPEDISFKGLDGGYGYIQWKAFNEPLYKIAVWEKFLNRFDNAPGIIIDLRNNGGGNLQLLYILASYLFTENAPVPLHWLESYSYDEKANDLVLELPIDYELSAPKQDLTYSGAVVVLVDENSASAAEFFPQFLQRHGRAIVVGEHGTDGAGGPIERISMPGGITFQYTKGRFTYAGTNELNLEGKGVDLDVRVPITEENERAKLEGRDPVLEAALVALAEAAAQRTTSLLTTTTWQWSAMMDTSGQRQPVEQPENYTVAFAVDGTVKITADCNQVSGAYTLGDENSITITIQPSMLAACPDGSRSEEFLMLFDSAVNYTFLDGLLGIVATVESSPRIMLFDPLDY